MKQKEPVTDEEFYEYLTAKFDLPEMLTGLQITVTPRNIVRIDYQYFNGVEILDGSDRLYHKQIK